MRYFLDTEFDGFGGDLISLGLAAEDGEDYYVVIHPLPDPPTEWVGRHVIPYLFQVPQALDNRLDREAAAHDLAAYLRADPDPFIVADWPEDIALFCRLLLIGDDATSSMSTGSASSSAAPPASPPRATARCRTTRCTMRARCGSFVLRSATRLSVDPATSARMTNRPI